ncbi:ATP-dependent RNA helicase DDX3X [Nematocida displodere]|uniref:RNA helicase n=1 Tax=Nematocida displodere TaxID=1805483 RepID=A0A177EKN7_9MICR|nr:ATP-dependent RNA helicase DDX3X [Nematocida displodere]
MSTHYVPSYMKEEQETEIKENGISIKAVGKIDSVKTFKGLMINPKILRNMEGKEIVDPTIVQKYVIPLALHGNDILTCAPTGMGKTVAFLVPAINALRGGNKGFGGKRHNPRVLILVPTRELAIQIHKECDALSQGMDITCALAYGGADNRRNQIATIKKGLDILIGTPGRLQDFLKDKHISFVDIEMLIFDEADRMLDMGFESQIKSLIHDFDKDKKRQTMMFSATFPRAVQRIAKDFFQQKPAEVHIGVGPKENITQEIINVSSSDCRPKQVKETKLLSLLEEYGYAATSTPIHTHASTFSAGPKLVWGKSKVETKPKQKTYEERPKIVIFVEKKLQCREISDFLHKKGIDCASIHGDKTQQEREEALGRFTQCDPPILIATSVAARGLDIPGIELVVNYTLPHELQEYIHRIGRTGRAGKGGRSVAFFGKEDMHHVPLLIDTLKKANQEVPSFLESMHQAQRTQPKTKTPKRKEGTGSFIKARDPAYITEQIKIEDNLEWDSEIQ